ncbi:putative ribonuclease H protein [Vitis vinifera]|uniref:Putative ribonuclease H protein n=1 Tax=Vitis vinifera TaxID=29760 RepID=A0A438JIG2_VITVI|nr:putative ribonuclease H protein [Vitis vinifera]
MSVQRTTKKKVLRSPSSTNSESASEKEVTRSITWIAALMNQLIFWKWVVICFEMVSGLKINLKKSEIIPVGGVEDVDRAAAVFGCKVGNLPTTYLGLPLGALHNSCRVWDGGDVEGRRRIHLVRWTAICKDKKYGGLGLRHLKEFNHALLGKWLWRFSLERESLWRKVIVGKFGEGEGGWTTREVRESYGMSLWKDIRKGWEEFFLRTSIGIGNGRCTRFWWDYWAGESKLKDLFPLLFRIASHNSALVADLWGRQGDGGRDGRCTLEDLFMIGNWGRKGKFSVKSYYRSLKVENNPFFPAKEVWGSRAPLRTRFFAWEAVWGKISTVDMLMRRGWSMVNRCVLCKENEESTDHILIHCGKTRELWTVVLSSFGVVWVFPNSVRNLLLEWKIKGLEKKRSVVWKMVPICLFWCIWGERNRRMFQEEEKSDMSLKNLFLRALLEWSQQVMDVDFLSFMNLLGG